MPVVTFTPNLQRHVRCPSARVTGGSVRQALEAVFEGNPQARSYVLEDDGGLRRHMVVFVDGCQVRDRRGLSDEVGETSEIYVMQALSGG
jgi:molybdopterin synthase sulfur carrier subunit